jgi:hypothetical protein
MSAAQYCARTSPKERVLAKLTQKRMSVGDLIKELEIRSMKDCRIRYQPSAIKTVLQSNKASAGTLRNQIPTLLAWLEVCDTPLPLETLPSRRKSKAPTKWAEEEEVYTLQKEYIKAARQAARITKASSQVTSAAPLASAPAPYGSIASAPERRRTNRRRFTTPTTKMPEPVTKSKSPAAPCAPTKRAFEVLKSHPVAQTTPAPCSLSSGPSLSVGPSFSGRREQAEIPSWAASQQKNHRSTKCLRGKDGAESDGESSADGDYYVPPDGHTRKRARA